MTREKNIKHDIIDFVVTGFYTGYFPFMPGTFGSLVGVFLFILLSPLGIWFYLIWVMILCLAIPITTYAEKHIYASKDPQVIVIDEILGMMATLFTFSFRGDIESWEFVIFGFLFFRLFDITKPTPIASLQKINGGFGVMIDDLFAAFYANLLLQIIRFAPSLLPL
ncbi:phosphatidylglycerophosphatase A family protein [Thermospira aquatica]|uniref:Phosphatidylglycerophosphatase A n=1 Tax=Thermospira aquatica TaxID=2828656 RepID=A0AAX3BB75_9SPIR|nr:phosphatidylglycerophosphatase A [Thermospira aquatica]URA09386.1 phosphatidylglycerophosphatase A [Thermospira aquatica]